VNPRRQQPLAMLGPPHAGGIVLGIDVEHADPGRLAASEVYEFTRVPTPQILEPMRIEHRILEAVRAGGPLIRAPAREVGVAHARERAGGDDPIPRNNAVLARLLEHAVDALHFVLGHRRDQAGNEQLVSNATTVDWICLLSRGIHRLDQIKGALRPAPDLFGTGFSLPARGATAMMG
jgi:hypothetical protein